jgi:hypothetical protein
MGACCSIQCVITVDSVAVGGWPGWKNLKYKGQLAEVVETFMQLDFESRVWEALASHH